MEIEKSQDKKRKNVRKNRKKIIEIRVSNDEYLELCNRSKTADLPLSTYLRQAGLNKQIYQKKEIPIKVEWVLQLAKIGNNLNQIAKAINTKIAKNESIEFAEFNLILHEILRDFEEIKQETKG